MMDRLDAMEIAVAAIDERSLAGAAALAVNLACALLLTRFRTHQGSLTPRRLQPATTPSLTSRRGWSPP